MEKTKHIIRVAATDLEGHKPLKQALQKVKGISHSFSNAVCYATKIDKKKKAGDLTKQEVEKIEDAIKNPDKYKIPSWILNREKDYETNQDKHLTNVELKLQKEFDVKRLRKIKSYRGLRHAVGLPVRGQRTRSNFRKGKAIGVTKKKKKGKTG